MRGIGCGDGVAHARGQVIPEQRRRFRHVASLLSSVRSSTDTIAAALLATGLHVGEVIATLGRQRVVQHVDELVVREVSHCSSFFRLRERVEKVCFDRTDRAAEDRGDLFVSQLMIDPQHERGALFPRQLRDRAAQLAGRSSRAQLVASAGSAARRGAPAIDRLDLRRFQRHAVEADVDGDAIQPGAERGAHW